MAVPAPPTSPPVRQTPSAARTRRSSPDDDAHPCITHVLRGHGLRSGLSRSRCRWPEPISPSTVKHRRIHHAARLLPNGASDLHTPPAWDGGSAASFRPSIRIEIRFLETAQTETRWLAPAGHEMRESAWAAWFPEL